MRAADGFDIAKGNRFSTYASLALMKGFARSVPQMMLAAQRSSSPDPAALDSLPDIRAAVGCRHLADRDQVTTLLSRLSDPEQQVVAARFGLNRTAAPATYADVGRGLGLSQSHIRRLEQSAIAKLRKRVSSCTTIDY